MAKRLVLILNPAAGLKQGKRYLADLITVFEEYDYECLTIVTRARGEATQAAARHCGDADLIVAVGGDGTLNEVLQGLVSCGGSCLIGYIPAGSTNDLGSSLGLNRNLLQCAREIMEGTPRGLDVGSFEGRCFSYIASFGLFTKASYSAPQNLKNLLGHVAYVLEGMKDLLSIRAEHLRLELENESIEDDFIFGAVSNSTSVGGVLTLSESLVSLDDGLFELLLIRMPRSVVELNQIIAALTSQNYDNPMLIFRSVSSVRVYGDPAMPWTLDGEFQSGMEQARIENLHRRVQILLPPRERETIDK